MPQALEIVNSSDVRRKVLREPLSGRIPLIDIGSHSIGVLAYFRRRSLVAPPHARVELVLPHDVGLLPQLALDVLKGFLLLCGGSSDLRLSAGGFGACFLSGTLGRLSGRFQRRSGPAPQPAGRLRHRAFARDRHEALVPFPVAFEDWPVFQREGAAGGRE